MGYYVRALPQKKSEPKWKVQYVSLAFFSTIIGMSIAKFASKKIGPIFSFIASLVLLVLGIKFLIDGL